jgi:WD40 repeat protein
LKPSNILIDKDGTPFVTDFGLAKRVNADRGLTQTGALVGTPSYMAPEQARGTAGLTTAADVYSLGAILYKQLTGRPPIEGESVLDTVRKVVEEDPVHPRALNPEADRDLSVIALHCLQKEPAKRYPSAAALADDLDRWQRGEPIAARPAGVVERTWRWARRHPALAGLTGLSAVLVLAVVAAVVQTMNSRRLKDAYDQAREAQVKAETQERQARDFWYAADIGLAFRHLEANQLDRAWGLLDRQRSSERRGFEWNYLRGLFGGERLALPGPSRCVALSADGRLLAVGGDGVTLWDSVRGTKLATLPDCATGVRAVAIRADGSLVAVPAAADGKIRLWDVAARNYTRTLPGHSNEVMALAFSPDGKTLVSGGRDDFIRWWDVASGKEIAVRKEHGNDVLALAWSPDGKRLASGGQDWVVHLWDAAGKHLRELRGHTGPVLAVAFSADGRELASGGGFLSEYTTVREQPGELFRWDMTNMKYQPAVNPHRGPVVGVAYRGQVLLSAGRDGTVKRWRYGNLEEDGAWRGHFRGVYGMAVAGPTLATAGPEEVKIWDPDHPAGRRTEFDLDDCFQTPRLSVRADDRIVDHTGKEWTARRWTQEAGRTVGLSPDGRTVAAVIYRTTVEREGPPGVKISTVASEPKVIRLLDRETWAVRAVLPTKIESSPEVDFDRTGRLVVAWGMNGPRADSIRRLEVWDPVEPTKPMFAVEEAGLGFEFATITPDGKTVAATIRQGGAKMWDMTTGAVRADWPESWAIAFAPIGGRMAVGAADGSVRVLETATLSEIGRAPGEFTGPVRHLAFAPDGRTMAVSYDADLWVGSPDPDNGWRRLDQPNGRAAFSPDGRTVATFDQTSITLWQVSTGQELVVVRPPRFWLRHVAFAADGRALIGLADHPRDEGTDMTVWPAGPP